MRSGWRIAIMIFCAFACLIANAQNRIAIQMGGNCEKQFNRSGEENIFLDKMALENRVLNNHGWETHTLYNGDTTPIEMRVANNKKTKGGSHQPSSKEAFFKKLDELIAKTANGNPSNQQVLISMNSHGNKGGICISETKTISYDDPELIHRLEALKEMQDVVKTPSKEKTNQERVVEIFQTNFQITREEAEKHLLKSIQTVFPQLESHFGKILGAADFVEWAKDHFTLTLATNPMWTTEFVHMRMRWGGINPDYFKSITTADRMHACKPLPEYYQELLRQEQFSAEDSLLVGNERRMDLPAVQTGLPV